MAGRLVLHRQHGVHRRTHAEQDPIVTFQFHLTHRFQGGMWLAGDVNYFTGGRTTIGDKASIDFQRNSRIGATFSKARSPQLDPGVGQPGSLHHDRCRLHFDRRSVTTTRGCASRTSPTRPRLSHLKEATQCLQTPTGPASTRATDVTDVMKRLNPAADFSLVLGRAAVQLWRRTTWPESAAIAAPPRLALTAAGLGAAAAVVDRGRARLGATSRCRSSTDVELHVACCSRCHC